MTRTCRRRRRRRARRYHKDRAMRPEHKRRPGRRRRFTRVYEDAEGLFRAAIEAGVLSADPDDRLYAGRYRYMFHDEDGTAWFRRCDRKDWVSMSAERRTAGERS